MEKCDLCGKKEEYDNYIGYHKEEFNLCKKHIREWNKEHKSYREEHKHINPCTKEWEKMCAEEEKLFIDWFEEQKKFRKTKKRSKGE